MRKSGSRSESFTVGPLLTYFLKRGPGEKGTWGPIGRTCLAILLECDLKSIK
jgi:hypothetical protein